MQFPQLESLTDVNVALRPCLIIALLFHFLFLRTLWLFLCHLSFLTMQLLRHSVCFQFTEPKLRRSTSIFFFSATQTHTHKQTASRPWGDLHWIWQKVYWIRITYSTFNSVLRVTEGQWHSSVFVVEANAYNTMPQDNILPPPWLQCSPRAHCAIASHLTRYLYHVIVSLSLSVPISTFSKKQHPLTTSTKFS